MRKDKIYYSHINDIYINDKLKNMLAHLQQYKITTVIAPMGYGKTTAIRWWSEQESYHKKESIFIKQMIISDNLSDYWDRLCKSVRHNKELFEQLTALEVPTTSQSIEILCDIIINAVESDVDIYYILDDLHIIKDERIITMLFRVAESLDDRFHFILMSRNQIFDNAQIIKMGFKLCQIDIKILRLNNKNIKEYSKSCGLVFDDRELNKLSKVSEGWISVIYLNFRAYIQGNGWFTNKESISQIIYDVLLQNLPEKQKKFLVIMGITDEFTLAQAEYIWEDKSAKSLLNNLINNNAFVSKNEYGVYRYHHMLQTCAREEFEKMSDEEKKLIINRLGEWYFSQKEFLMADKMYYRIKNFKKLIETIKVDCGRSINSDYSEAFRQWITDCDKNIISDDPAVIPVLMRKMFTFNYIEDLFQLKAMLDESLKKCNLSQVEKNNILGECEIVLSFLKFNNITAMSEHHKKASELMNRYTQCIDNKGSWTFGSPSIIMMYHRNIGCLDDENIEMHVCMPYYYQITDGHGTGVEHVMQAETYFERCEFNDAKICCSRAINDASKKKQYSILLVAKFLEMRIKFLENDIQGVYDIIDGQKQLYSNEKQYMLLNIFDICETMMYSFMGIKDKVSEWLTKNKIEMSLAMFPAMPVMQGLYRQLLLSNGDWAEIIACKDEYNNLVKIYNNISCMILHNVQLSIAYMKLGKRIEAVKHLQNALELALPDRLYMVFAENYEDIKEILSLPVFNKYAEEIEKIKILGEKIINIRNGQKNSNNDMFEKYGLTKREKEVATLVIQRLTNKEIANKLFIAEGTVKNILVKVFDKCGITGEMKNKRMTLINITK